MRYISIVLLIIVGIVIIGGCSIAVAAAEQVDPGEVRVVTSFGKPTGRVLHPGLSFINPLRGEDAISINTQPRVYETSEFPDQSKADFTDYRVDGRTTDGQEVIVSYSATFHVPNSDKSAICVIENYGNMKNVVERLVKTHTRSRARLDIQSFTAEALYGGTDVFEYENRVFNNVSENFANLGCGVILDSFLIRGIQFDADYVQSIEDQQIQEVQIKTAQFQADQAKEEARRTVTLEQGKADAQVVSAKGQAEAVKLAADADAYSITAKAKAQAEANQLLARSLSTPLLQYQFINNMDAVNWGFLPSEGILPFLPLETP